MELGRYRILSQLGQGGMATVYLAQDPLLNRLVAIKVIQSHLTNNNSLIERFTVEAKTIAALRHMNIVEVFDFGIQDNQQFLVMEYIDGQNLQTLCGAMAGSPMHNTVAAAILCQAAEGLTSAEKHGVVHRDIKPENLLFNSEGVLKIADFGIAHIADEQSRTQTGAVLGSPNFMSPEQIEGAKPTHRTDLFSLGGVFYYAMTGKLPFTGPSIPVTMRNISEKPHQGILELNPGADPFLASLVDALLQKNPEERPEGARWLANQLRSWLNHSGVVDIVEHCRNYIQSLGITNSQTISEGSSIPGKPLRPGTRMGTGPGGTGINGQPSGMRSGASQMGMPGQQSGYPPTTGAMGPSSRSPMVWAGAMVAVAVLVLAGTLVWFKNTPETAANGDKPVTSAITPKVSVRPSNPTPVVQPQPTPTYEAPKPVEPIAQPKTVLASPVTEPTYRTGRQTVTAQQEQNTYRYEKPKYTKPNRLEPEKPEVKALARPNPPEPSPSPGGMGAVLVKSAPPFAALTINGKPQGETPMNAWLDVPVGRCHIEIVHRLTPPFDTTINVTAGSKQEFKFKLDR